MQHSPGAALYSRVSVGERPFVLVGPQPSTDIYGHKALERAGGKCGEVHYWHTVSGGRVVSRRSGWRESFNTSVQNWSMYE